MALYLLNTLPSWLIICLFVLVSIPIALVIGFLFRRVKVKLEDRRTVDAHFGANATLVFIFLAFIIVNIWQEFSVATGIVNSEAVALISIYRDADLFDAKNREAVRGAIKKYTKAVIDFDFPSMQWGTLSIESENALLGLFRVIGNIEKESKKQLSYEVLSQLNSISQNRSLRLQAAKAYLPLPVYLTLFLGALTMIVIGSVGTMDNHVQHMWLIVALTGVFALFLGLAFVIDHPFSGIAVSPDPYLDAMEFFSKIGVSRG